jgi:ATP-binding cassette subfamily B protein/subfamily B ATP-binding cassette protein MsbA
VRTFGQEEREHSRFRALTGQAVRAHERGSVIGSLATFSGGMVTAVGTAVILLFGAQAVLAGSMTTGDLLVFIAYLATLQSQFSALSGVVIGLQTARGSLERVAEVLDAPPEIVERPGAPALPPVRGHVRVEGVVFGYEPGRPVLRGVRFEARPGETVALVGATGAGKSTLASLVPRLVDPWLGRVTIDGHDLREVSLRSVREQVAVVLQEPFLFPITIAENIAYGRPSASRAEIEAAATAADAHAFVERLPEGYDTIVGERGATLSGGERQRLSIARALLKDAPILVLDEPTSALDAGTELTLLRALERLMAGRTTLVIAHRLSTVRRADRIVVLHEGRIAETGTHADLLAAGGLYAYLHRIQFRDEDEPPDGPPMTTFA